MYICIYICIHVVYHIDDKRIDYEAICSMKWTIQIDGIFLRVNSFIVLSHPEAMFQPSHRGINVDHGIIVDQHLKP